MMLGTSPGKKSEDTGNPTQGLVWRGSVPRRRRVGSYRRTWRRYPTQPITCSSSIGCLPAPPSLPQSLRLPLAHRAMSHRCRVPMRSWTGRDDGLGHYSGSGQDEGKGTRSSPRGALIDTASYPSLCSLLCRCLSFILGRRAGLSRSCPWTGQQF